MKGEITMGESYECMKRYGESGTDKNSARYTNELLEKILQKLDNGKQLNDEETELYKRIRNN